MTAFESAEVLAIRGGRPLRGRVEVKGAKNLVTKAMVAALLGETASVLRDVPAISDVQVVRSLLEAHGVRVWETEDEDEGTLHLDPSGTVAPPFAAIDAHAGVSRIPILFCGPLLHLLGQALIPNLGGCRIGERPINFHTDALRAFGAVVDESYQENGKGEGKGIRITAPNGLHGADIELPYPSVGATEQVLLTAVRAKGMTRLRGAAIDPEILDLIAVLRKMGAIISHEADHRVITIEGVDSLQGYDHQPIPDRNEVASWACAALATAGDIFVGGARPQDMLAFLDVYLQAGGSFDVCEDGIRFRRGGGDLRPVVVETDVHPGFMTDWQQPLVVALTQAHGTSTVHETVYGERLGFTRLLNRMGADIVVHAGRTDGPGQRVSRCSLEQAAVIKGPTALRGAEVEIEVEVPDLRGAYSYVIAALMAEGESVVRNIGVIRRGYERFLVKLDALGADFDVIS
ncbi:UDP-N-acetylglucosamine 1-carboxyvinyltransferase [Nemania sp. FL0031]|nr:UDP-N-acetylglucosamine 1-carboxyvinyltransferase [Nemania sp. FL0031]